MNPYNLSDQDLNTIVNALRFAADEYHKLAQLSLPDSLKAQFERQAKDALELANELE